MRTVLGKEVATSELVQWASFVLNHSESIKGWDDLDQRSKVAVMRIAASALEMELGVDQQFPLHEFGIREVMLPSGKRSTAENPDA